MRISEMMKKGIIKCPYPPENYDKAWELLSEMVILLKRMNENKEKMEEMKAKNDVDYKNFFLLSKEIDELSKEFDAKEQLLETYKK